MAVRMLWHGRPAHVPISTGKLPVSRCPILMRGTSQTNRACALLGGGGGLRLRGMRPDGRGARAAKCKIGTHNGSEV